jgi:hypothetical protein
VAGSGPTKDRTGFCGMKLRKTSPGESTHTEISPLRYASV